MRCCFNVFPRMQSGFNVSSKLCSNLWSRRAGHKGLNRFFCNTNVLGTEF